MSTSPRPPAAPETTLLAAIHAHSQGLTPSLRAVVPWRARCGEPVVLYGAGLEPPLRAVFGTLSTWAISIDGRRALAVVPAAAGAGPLWLERHGLRSNRIGFGGPPGDDQPSIVRIDPPDGSSGVFRDAPVVIRLSHAADPSTVGPYTVRVSAGGELVPGPLSLSPDGTVVIWTPGRLLAPGIEHGIEVSGLRDRRGLVVGDRRSTFVAGAFTLEDLLDMEPQ